MEFYEDLCCSDCLKKTVVAIGKNTATLLCLQGTLFQPKDQFPFQFHTCVVWNKVNYYEFVHKCKFW